MLKSMWLSIAGIFVGALVGAQLAESACFNREFVIDIGNDPSPAQSQVFTDQALYLLNGVSPDKSCAVMRAMQIQCSNLDDLACVLAPNDQNVVDFDELRDFYHRHHHLTVSVRRHDDFIKNTLLEFTAVTNFQDWPYTVIARSGVKRKTRVIYRSPPGLGQEISVAQTRDCIDGDLQAPLLETEVAIRRHGSGRNYEFYVYSPDGLLADHSMFPAGERPAPTVCVSCHYDTEARTVSRFIPIR